jgi:Uma2 family endonuclease
MVLSQTPDAVVFPPGDLDSDEPPLETDLHLRQIILLLLCLEWWWQERPDAPESRRNNFYAAGNLTIYYSNRQRRNEKFRGPDFFVVLDTEYKPRKSWVVWDEDGKYPNVIVEMLSDSTADTDKGLKKRLYQDTFRTPEYFWFDPYSLEFKGFRLQGSRYQEIETTEQGWMWSQELELYLGVVEGKLRFLTPEGELVPAPTETALQERLRAETERQRADAEYQRAEAERQRADTEYQRAEAERQRADAAEAELERLRRQIQERGTD